MPSNCGPSNCVGNSCLIKRRTKKSRKSRKSRSTRSKRLIGGAPPTEFTVVLFSAEPIAEETKDGVRALLTGLYGATEMPVKIGGDVFADFKDFTGLKFNEKVKDRKNSIAYKIKVAPAILRNTNLKTDKRLTILEGEIGNALLKSGLEVSLIEITHGLRPNSNSAVNEIPNMYYIGLCTPKCAEYDKETFNSYISQEAEDNNQDEDNS